MSILRSIRESVGMSAEDLSIKLGIRATNVHKAERGGNPTLSKIKEVARACRVKKVVIEVEL